MRAHETTENVYYEYTIHCVSFPLPPQIHIRSETRRGRQRRQHKFTITRLILLDFLKITFYYGSCVLNLNLKSMYCIIIFKFFINFIGTFRLHAACILI